MRNSYILKNHFNIILPSTPTSSKLPFSFTYYSTKTLHTFLIPPMLAVNLYQNMHLELNCFLAILLWRKDKSNKNESRKRILSFRSARRSVFRQYSVQLCTRRCRTSTGNCGRASDQMTWVIRCLCLNTTSWSHDSVVDVKPHSFLTYHCMELNSQLHILPGLVFSKDLTWYQMD